ncbi:class I lanthipeptide [Chitinophaga oryzae]|uniref:Class I lanthipeptide n=1 Tax=Chitinophaga oryzae TaxID=2725414 RepID=A0AAE6ZNA9_9BACT|nr:class I lanthipeptide [Chitinophaga oryzae]QJB35879.1 class I lanthipeptide [Chitinophaga oryzae]QJB42403.1 class I lanthipeptide [Chitinophaga oryzae]
MKKKKPSLTKKLMFNKSTISALSDQKELLNGRISYHTFIHCDDEVRRKGQFC